MAAAVVVAVLTLAMASAASRVVTPVQIIYITPTVSPGGVLTIKLLAPQGARCGAILTAAHGASVVLWRHASGSARITLTYQLPTGAKAGRWRARISCTSGGSAAASFLVATPGTPAQVSVVKSGFATQTFGSDVFYPCGLVLQNSSPDADARDVTVTVQFVDTLGRSLASDELHLTVIPAGQTFYASCLVAPKVTLSVAALKVGVVVGKSVPKKVQLPAVSGLALTQDKYGNSQTLTGNFTNPYSKAMPQEARIYAVYFDASGNIIGGDATTADAAVSPGATVGFNFPYLDEGVAKAEVSVDPCGSASMFNACAVAS